MSKKNKNKSQHQGNLSKSILDILRKDAGKTFNHKQIAAKLGVNDANSRNNIIKKLAQLAAKKQIEEEGRGKFKIVKSNDYYRAVIDMTTKGYAYAMVDELEDDVFISPRDLNTAFNGDEVEIYIQFNPPGEVIERCVFSGLGCALSMVASDILCELLEGQKMKRFKYCF